MADNPILAVGGVLLTGSTNPRQISANDKTVPDDRAAV